MVHAAWSTHHTLPVRYCERVSAERDELLRLVREIPDEQVPEVLADVRKHLYAVPSPTWPPDWFGSAEGDGTAYGARSEELLGDGFGQSA
ncbi:hypothetical protein FG87_37765 [Nocardia vulneris]|uniref:Uncharacterized protein n=1 Tax=Nocardia vulneris TaxID=1141657 RepID=A0ABR4Z5H3_9NOCA|nr:hypothetical protein FG87_37765 [Nocardia vulneris]